MPELNRANRQVCDVDIRILSTKAPFLWFDTANTTTAGLSGDNVYAMAKGAKKIGFANPLEGTMSIEAQVYPFKLFAMMSDGTISSSAITPEKKTITASTGGELAITDSAGTIEAGTVFVYPEGEFGDESSAIAGTFASGTFTATTSSQIASGSKYEVGYLLARATGVKKIAFNNAHLPQDYFITMSTVDKDENGTLTPFLMTAYKAQIQRTFDMSFSSEGDPCTVTLNFDLLSDKDNNVLDFVEITGTN